VCNYVIQPAKPSIEADTYSVDISDRAEIYLYTWSVPVLESSDSGRRRLEVANFKDFSDLYTNFDGNTYDLVEITK